MENTITAAPQDTYLVHVYKDRIEYMPVVAYEFMEKDYQQHTLFRCVVDNTIGDTGMDLIWSNMDLMRVTGLMQASGRIFHGWKLFDDIDAFTTYANEERKRLLKRKAELRQEARLKR